MFHQSGKTRNQKLIESYEFSELEARQSLDQITLTLFETLGRPATLSRFLEDLEIYCEFTNSKIVNGEAFAGLKFVLMMHCFLMRAEKYLRYDESNRPQIFTHIEGFLAKINGEPKNRKAQKIPFRESLLLPYSFYLIRKIQFISEKILDTSQKRAIQISKKGIYPKPKPNKKFFQEERQSDQNQNIRSTLQKHYEQCYKYINLLNNGLKLSGQLLSLLRYYRMQIWALTELNIALAMDFYPIYVKIAEQIQYIKKIEDELDIQSLQYAQLMKEIQKINEKMFVITLNRYNSFYLTRYVPKWIEVELKYAKSNTPSKQIQAERLSNSSLSGANFGSIEDDLMPVGRQRSKTMQEKNPEIETNATLNNKTERCEAGKQKQRQTILQELQNNFRKYYNKEQPANFLKDKTRVKKNRSFYEAKKPHKLTF